MDASNILQSAIDGLASEAAVIVPAALVVGVALLGVRRGWGYVKGFSK